MNNYDNLLEQLNHFKNAFIQFVSKKEYLPAAAQVLFFINAIESAQYPLSEEYLTILASLKKLGNAAARLDPYSPEICGLCSPSVVKKYDNIMSKFITLFSE